LQNQNPAYYCGSREGERDATVRPLAGVQFWAHQTKTR